MKIQQHWIKEEVMSNKCKLIIYSLVGMLLVVLTIINPTYFKAEEKEAELVYLEQEENCTVIFYYDVERPDIVLISPSGQEYEEGVTDEALMKVSHGDGWSAYTIVRAQQGQWHIRYDKKGNTKLEFGRLETVTGIVIEQFTVNSIVEDIAVVEFSASKGNEIVQYKYVISAVTPSGKVELVSGTAQTGERITTDVVLDIPSNDNCQLVLTVVHSDWAETFDSVTSEPFVYENPKTVSKVRDFEVTIDMTNSRCYMDWSSYKSIWRKYQYKVEAFANEELLFSSDLGEEDETSFTVPLDTEILELRLYCVDGLLTSEATVKTIDLKQGEFLRLATEDNTEEALVKLEYNSVSETRLTVKLNGTKEQYKVTGEGHISFPLQTDSNALEASFEGENNVTYYVNREILHNIITPAIKVYENLHGKQFYTDVITVVGCAERAKTLFINDASVEMEESGFFSYDISLAVGENNIVIEAISKSGISTVLSFTVEKITSSAIEKVPGDWLDKAMFAVIAIGLVGLCLILLVPSKKRGLLFYGIYIEGMITILEGLAIYAFVQVVSFVNSIAYIELAMVDIDAAVAYLQKESWLLKVLTITSIVWVVVLCAMIAWAVIKKRRFVKANVTDKVE